MEITILPGSIEAKLPELVDAFVKDLGALMGIFGPEASGGDREGARAPQQGAFMTRQGPPLTGRAS